MWCGTAAMASLAAAFMVMTGLSATAEAAGPGTVVAATGHGTVEDATFANDAIGSARFDFFVGYDRNDELFGSFNLRRVVPGKGVRGQVGIEITDLTGPEEDDGCMMFTMTGTSRLYAYWTRKGPHHVEAFQLTAWDCDGESTPDKVWFGVWTDYVGGDNRPGLTLKGVTDLAKGNITIR